MSSHTDTQTDYYTIPCKCGANPAFHIGHTQACADAHAAATAQTAAAVSLKGLKVTHRRYTDITGVIVHLSGIDGTLTVKWNTSGEESDGWTPEELVVSLADVV